MKHYMVVAITDTGTDVSVSFTKNKFDAIKRGRDACSHKKYVPIYVKKLSNKYAKFLVSIVHKEK